MSNDHARLTKIPMMVSWLKHVRLVATGQSLVESSAAPEVKGADRPDLHIPLGPVTPPRGWQKICFNHPTICKAATGAILSVLGAAALFPTQTDWSNWTLRHGTELAESLTSEHVRPLGPVSARPADSEPPKMMLEAIQGPRQRALAQRIWKQGSQVDDLKDLVTSAGLNYDTARFFGFVAEMYDWKLGFFTQGAPPDLQRATRFVEVLRHVLRKAEQESGVATPDAILEKLGLSGYSNEELADVDHFLFLAALSATHGESYARVMTFAYDGLMQGVGDALSTAFKTHSLAKGMKVYRHNWNQALGVDLDGVRWGVQHSTGQGKGNGDLG